MGEFSLLLFALYISCYPSCKIKLVLVLCPRNSCGLFVLECMEHWDGDKMTREISQVCIFF